MANAYGTKEYDKYVDDYYRIVDKYNFVKTEKTEERFEINGIKIEFICFDHQLFKSKNDLYPFFGTTFNEISITLKDGRAKKFNTTDHGLLPQVFSYNGIDYIFMRKTLYGYCIIDSRDFSEYNYFPSAVLHDGGEAFISCKVHCLKDLLIIDGCYWAAPYELYVLDLGSKKSIRLNDYLGFQEFEGISLGEDSIKFYENGFYVIDDDSKKEYPIDYFEIKRHIKKDGQYDL